MQQYFVKGSAISPVTIEDKETSVQLDGETVSRSVTQRQNRRELMRGKAVTP